MNWTKKPMTVGIVGAGVVGRALAGAYKEHTDVRVYDVDPQRRLHSLPEALEGDLIFLCLPTPQGEDGRCDLSDVEGFCKDHQGYTKCFILKSTVPVGTTTRLSRTYDLPNLVHCPEFLTARTANLDARMPTQLVVGIPATEILSTRQMVTPARLLRLFGMVHHGVPLRVMPSEASEAVKLITNGFYAVKVAYFNEVRALCEAHDLKWQAVLDAVLASGRICPSHTQVPGPDGKYGFGGDCLPKDLRNLIDCLRAVGEPPSVCEAADERNESDRVRGTYEESRTEEEVKHELGGEG